MNIPTQSRTKHDMFEEWNNSEHEYLEGGFREYWNNKWKEHLELYKQWGLFVFPIVPRIKRPLSGWSWTEKPLDWDTALEYVSKDLNLAVVLGNSNLFLIDWDTRTIPQQLYDFLSKTLCAISPRGWHIYFRPSEETEETYNKIRKVLGGKTDMFRGDMHYALLPLSVVAPTCPHCGNRIYYYDNFCRGCGKKCGTHPKPKIYEWINMHEPISFEELKKAII